MPDVIDLKGMEDCRALPIQPAVAWHVARCTFMLEDDGRVEVTPNEFYFTDAITDKAITMVEDAVEDQHPFFLYLAHAAPHCPLHAPAEDIARYDGVYNKGWDAIRTSRHEEMNGRRILQANWDISPRDSDVMPWSNVQLKDWEASKMVTYAAMVDSMDQSIGRLVAALERLDQLDNTLILFLSDNGGCAEFMAEDGWAQYYPDVTLDGSQVTMGNVPENVLGTSTIIIPSAGGWIEDDQGRILLQKRSATKEQWGFPGGIVDIGESASETAVREVLEETGLVNHRLH